MIYYVICYHVYNFFYYNILSIYRIFILNIYLGNILQTAINSQINFIDILVLVAENIIILRLIVIHGLSYYVISFYLIFISYLKIKEYSILYLKL